MPTLSFIGQSSSTVIGNLSGSGIGLYGSSFGASVAVNAYQDSTWITDSTGASQGAQLNNTKYMHSSGVSVNGAANITPVQLPNYLCPLNARFTHSSSVKCQNSKLYIYDRTSQNSDPSGVVAKILDVVHPHTSQAGSVPGSGSSSWSTLYGSGSIMTMTLPSPGTSGLAPSGPNTSDTQHDWYFAISASPSSVGSKDKFAALIYTEYL
jgi:hypothetical protein